MLDKKVSQGRWGGSPMALGMCPKAIGKPCIKPLHINSSTCETLHIKHVDDVFYYCHCRTAHTVTAFGVEVDYKAVGVCHGGIV